MWSRAFEWVAEAERLHRQFFRLAATDSALAAWEPPIDVLEDENEVIVVVAMPGVAADSVEVKYDARVLVVRGTRRVSLEGARYRLRHLEIPYGAFERRVALAPGPLEVGRPELAHGCLVLRLRKLAAVRR
jgi:HSP20 family protein